MKKVLLVALLAAAGFASAADSVSLFGTVDAGLSNTKAVGASTSTTSFTSGGMTTSNWGVKGSQDLGAGSTAFFEVSSFFNVGTGATAGGTTTNLFARSSFVGLANKDLGSIKLGRDINPSFLPTILFNAFGDSSVYSPLWHATYFGGNNPPSTAIYNDTAWDNSVTYTTPTIGGVTASAMGSHNTTGGTNSGGNAFYNAGPLSLTAYYQRTEINSSGSFQTNIYTNAKPSDAYGVGASFDAGVAKVFATYQDAKDLSLNVDAKTYQVSTAVPVGRGNALAEYANTKYNTATTYAETMVGYDLPLSKKVDVYANAGRFTQTSLSNGQIYGAGLRVRF